MAGVVTENNMANELDQFNLSQAGTLPPELYAQQQALNRQQQMATMLMQQNQQPQGQMISGRYVPTSFFQNLAPIANMLTGAYLAKQGDTKAAELVKQLREGKNTAEEKIIQQMTGTPAQATEMAGPYAGNVPMPVGVQPAVAPNLAGALRDIRTNPYGAGKEYTSSILKQMMPEATTLEKEWKAAQTQGYTGTINDFKNQMNEYQKIQAVNDKQRLNLEGARFGLEKEKFALEQGGGKLTESQGNATAFGMRMKESNQLLNNLEKQGVKDTGIVRSTVGGIVGMTPFVGEKMQQGVQSSMNVLPGALGGPSPQQQETDAARKNFVTAVLRKESGAAISPSEFYTESQKYFPQPGDSDSVVKQKQHARETAIKAMEVQAGPGKRQIEQMGAGKVINFNDLP
jgi:hypothetical protein